MKNELKNKIIYQVFVRNFTKEGTFNALKEKLDYIKNLGTDIIYLLPISPIGKVNRKGSLGSPYSISDYMAINEELGSEEDFVSLINKTHEMGMKIMIDIVFNHTSRDSFIYKNHNEWMYKNEKGECANKVGDWSDVYDLDTTNDELIAYLVNVIRYYSSLGVDGYRFDVASLISKKFYEALKEMLDKEYPETILLAESIHASFNNYVRSIGFNALSDSELYSLGFDLCYMYNTIEPFDSYIKEKNERYLDIYKVLLNNEEAYNPSSALRIRGLENHDQPRLIELNKNKRVRRNLASFPTFMKGPMFIYNGLESKADHQPTLFDKDLIDMSIDKEWYDFIISLVNYKKEKMNLDILTSEVLLTKGDNLAIKNNYKDGSYSYGLFSFTSSPNGSLIKDEKLINGAYVDYFTSKVVVIENNSIRVKEPLFLFKSENIDK